MFGSNGPADYEVIKEITRLTRSINPIKLSALTAPIMRALSSLRQEESERPIVRNFQGNVLIVRKGDPR